MDVKKSVANFQLYEIYSGKMREAKMWTSQYNRNPFEEKDILYIVTLDKRFKKEPTGEINPVTGKKIYKDVPNKYEHWLERFIVKNEIEEEEEL